MPKEAAVGALCPSEQAAVTYECNYWPIVNTIGRTRMHDLHDTGARPPLEGAAQLHNGSTLLHRPTRGSPNASANERFVGCGHCLGSCAQVLEGCRVQRHWHLRHWHLRHWYCRQHARPQSAVGWLPQTALRPCQQDWRSRDWGATATAAVHRTPASRCLRMRRPLTPSQGSPSLRRVVLTRPRCPQAGGRIRSPSLGRASGGVHTSHKLRDRSLPHPK